MVAYFAVPIYSIVFRASAHTSDAVLLPCHVMTALYYRVATS